MDAKEKGVPGELKMPPEMVRAVCDKAHAAGYKVAAHVESPEGVKVALENGVDSIEHGAKPDEEILRLFKERNAYLCTTISPALPYALFDRSITNATEVEQFNGNVVFEGIIACAKAALENGIPVVLGNDVGCPWITQYDFWRELYYFHKYDFIVTRGNPLDDLKNLRSLDYVVARGKVYRDPKVKVNKRVAAELDKFLD